eukprot:c7486_g2_i1 orf=1-1131(-)
MNRGARGKIVDSMFPCEKGVAPLPSPEYLAQMLYRCRQERDQAQARCLLVCMRKNGLEAHQLLGNGLVVMLVEVGNVRDAQHVFHSLVSQEEYSWSSSIIGYIQCGKPQHAFSFYQMIQGVSSVHLSKNALKALLKTCTQLKELERGVELHAEMSRMGLLDSDIFVGNMLVDMYAKHGYLLEAQEVFSELPIRDVVSWTALIGGFAELDFHEQALDSFEYMNLEDVSPNSFTYGFGLKACGGIKDYDKGMQLHSQVVKQGLEKDVFVCNALVGMYTQCGSLSEAEEVFATLSNPGVISWNILIEGYVDHGLGKESLTCFDLMQQEGVIANVVTYICTLRACGSLRDLDRGQEIYSKIVEEELEGEVYVGNSLVDMYA